MTTNPYYVFRVIFLLIIPANISAVNSENRLVLYATIDFDEIVESSGLIKSKNYPGVFWTHNDSGDFARIFAISEDGKIVKPEWFKGKYKGIEVVNAANIDWEDIATDGAGNLIIGDFGNNWKNRQDLQLYVIMEPNPYKTLKTEAIISNESNELYRLTLKQIKAVESDQAGLIPPSVEHHDLVD